MRKALIVLSEFDVARLVAQHLACQGFQSEVLTEAQPVFRHAREGRPDLIILNYNSLPDVFGADVCRGLVIAFVLVLATSFIARRLRREL
jgi:DNA-binding response OmpR family regulator